MIWIIIGAVIELFTIISVFSLAAAAKRGDYYMEKCFRNR